MYQMPTKSLHVRHAFKPNSIKNPLSGNFPLNSPFLFRIHGDVCGPINPPSGAFHYFFILADASGSHSEVSLLTTRNMVFPKLLGILIRYRHHFPEFPIKHLRMDNAQEFRSHTFEDYCVASGINLTYLVPYEHDQRTGRSIHQEDSTSNQATPTPD